MSIFGFIVGCCVLCLLSEIFNFTLIALFIYYFGTTRFSKYEQIEENKILQEVIQFISDGRSDEDKALRVFAINTEYYHSFSTLGKHRKLLRFKFAAWIDTIEENESLELITWENMRLNAMNEAQQRYANFWNHILLKTMFEQLDEEITTASNSNNCMSAFIRLGGYIMLYFLLPLYLLSKIVTLLYPLIITGVVSIAAFGWAEIPMFQFIMLITYVFMIVIVITFGIPTLRLLFWLWHIAPGDEHIIMQRIRMKKVENYYDKLMLTPFIEKLVITTFGQDVGDIIMDYYKNIRLERNSKK